MIRELNLGNNIRHSTCRGSFRTAAAYREPESRKQESRGLEWRGLEWRGLEWRGLEWRGLQWRGLQWRSEAYWYSRTRRAIARPSASRTDSMVIRSKICWKNPVTII